MPKKPIAVTITQTKHKGKQVWTARIEQGKTDTILSQRFASPWSAKRGVRRKLDARTQHVNPMDPEPTIWITPEGREIVFTVKRKK